MPGRGVVRPVRSVDVHPDARVADFDRCAPGGLAAAYAPADHVAEGVDPPRPETDRGAPTLIHGHRERFARASVE